MDIEFCSRGQKYLINFRSSQLFDTPKIYTLQVLLPIENFQDAFRVIKCVTYYYNKEDCVWTYTGERVTNEKTIKFKQCQQFN